ncbi:MAG: pilin [Patescibacteria group bacterium]|nr:pilin [Patescibacteria group bacterium]MDD4304091.1 pilin [Patescibacteria group bacterium]MDD4694968.1 pilin [Patescibacteria group bacterium]
MKKIFKIKFILFIFLLFFVFDINILNAQYVDQPCSNFAGAECVWQPNVFQYEIIQHSVCPDTSQTCVRRRPNCTGECRQSYNCQNQILGFCDGTINTSCCGGNMTAEQQASAERILAQQRQPVCLEGQIYLEVPIPGLGKCVDDFSDYMIKLYDYLVYLAGVLAVVVIMIGGFQWVSAGGNQSKIGEAKERISGAIIGLVLAIGSYLILDTINPNLLSMRMPSVRNISAVPIRFSTEEHMNSRAAAIADNITCNSNIECSRYDRICAPRRSDNVNQKICMNQSYDNGQCDEDEDCLQGLICNMSSYQCAVPDILKCIGQTDLGARCFQSLYPLVSGYCTSGNRCTLCNNSGADCSIGILGNVISTDLFADNDSICMDQYEVCGQINRLTTREEFHNLPPVYKQQPAGNCIKNCSSGVGGVVGAAMTTLIHVGSYVPLMNICTYNCK